MFSKVPGRMGMILTLFLIHANVYNSVDGPKSRGMSYIEIWMIGTQIPILVALTEYGFVLYWKKIAEKSNQIHPKNENESIPDLDEKIKKLDLITMICSVIYLFLFTFFYAIGNPLKYLI